jgi:hypothetical protein
MPPNKSITVPKINGAQHQDKRIEVPWWAGRTLSYSFPAR